MISGAVLLIVGVPMMAAAIPGDPAARFANALLAASAAALSGIAVEFRRHGRIDAAGPWGAALGGLVAGSLSGPALPFVAIVLGAIVGLLEPIFRRKLDLKLRIDEPSGLSLPHLLGGLAGAIGATLGAAVEGRVGAGEVALLSSIGFSAAIVVAVVGIVVAYLAATIVGKAGGLRVDKDAEAEGLDLARHDVNAYPDFQQTLIKSYHLRQ
jgi:Amt family ammonium transporter